MNPETGLTHCMACAANGQSCERGDGGKGASATAIGTCACVVPPLMMATHFAGRLGTGKSLSLGAEPDPGRPKVARRSSQAPT